MNKQEWNEKKKFCIEKAEKILKEDVRLEDDNGVQFVPSIIKFTPPIPCDDVFVTENEIMGGTADWRVNNTLEYLLINGERVLESDCIEVIE